MSAPYDIRPPASTWSFRANIVGKRLLAASSAIRFRWAGKASVGSSRAMRAPARSRDPREGAVDLAGTTRLEELKSHPQSLGHNLRVAQLWCAAWVGRIREDCHS